MADFGRCSVCLPDDPRSIADTNAAMCKRLNMEEPMASPALSTRSSFGERDSGQEQPVAASEGMARKFDYFCVTKCLVMLDWP